MIEQFHATLVSESAAKTRDTDDRSATLGLYRKGFGFCSGQVIDGWVDVVKAGACTCKILFRMRLTFQCRRENHIQMRPNSLPCVPRLLVCAVLCRLRNPVRGLETQHSELRLVCNGNVQRPPEHFHWRMLVRNNPDKIPWPIGRVRKIPRQSQHKPISEVEIFEVVNEDRRIVRPKRDLMTKRRKRLCHHPCMVAPT